MPDAISSSRIVVSRGCCIDLCQNLAHLTEEKQHHNHRTHGIGRRRKLHVRSSYFAAAVRSRRLIRYVLPANGRPREDATFVVRLRTILGNVRIPAIACALSCAGWRRVWSKEHNPDCTQCLVSTLAAQRRHASRVRSEARFSSGSRFPRTRLHLLRSRFL